MKRSGSWWWMGLLVAMSVAACADDRSDVNPGEGAFVEASMEAKIAPDGYDPPWVDQGMMHHVKLAGLEQTAQLFEGGIARLTAPKPFRQLSWMMDAYDVSALQYRARRADGSYTDWEDVHVYYSEGILHNARILLDVATEEVQLRGGEQIVLATFEFYEEIVAPQEIVHPRRAPAGGLESAANLEEELRTTRHAVAPADLVISRHDWEAIDPDKICNEVVDPYRMSIHHTASPSTDGPDAAARMRTMQSNHINGRGWCDIGYHFVVAQSGAIYQGRSRSNRPGAHVSNHNDGNVGVSFIANFEEQVPTQTQFESGAKIVKWIYDTHGVPLDRTVVKGHQEWPGTATACPGRNMLSQLSKLLEMAGGDGTDVPIGPDPNVNYAVEFDVRYRGLENFYPQGSSAQLPDALPGDTFQAEIVVKNASNGPLRGVRLSYAFEEPFITATHYVIETDSPERDGRSFKPNDADEAPENPAKNAMGAEGTLTMYAFGAGETKRVLIDLQAERYSVGFADHPSLRSWIANIDGAYVQGSFGQEPTTNHVGDKLEDWAQMDVLSRDEWMFNGPDPRDLEGWSPAGDQNGASLDDGILSIEITGPRAALVSPEWTRIDADQYDQLVLVTRSNAGTHVKGISWKRDGESYDNRRVVRFAATEDGELQTYVVPMSAHPDWSGIITGLRIHLLDGATTGYGTHGLDMVYFQASDTGQTTSFTEGFTDAAPVALVGAARLGPDLDRYVTPSLGDGTYEGLSVRSGCAASGSSSPSSMAWLVALGLFFIGRRRDR